MRFYVPFVAALLAVPAFAQNPPSEQIATLPTTGWVVDPKTGCKVWDAVPDPEERTSWSGNCVNGMAEGKGTLQFFIGGKPATRYEGDMRNGRADGHGVNIEPDGGRYEGQWRNNAAHGFGIYTRGDERYEGTWVNGCLKQGPKELTVGVTRDSCGFK